MPNFEPGVVIDGRYRIEAELGRGGMSMVFRALDLRLSRFVVLKVLPPPLAEDPEFVSRFQQEIRVLTQLDHPNILRIYDSSSSQEATYLVLEYVAGGSLEEYLSRMGRLDPESALAIIEQIGPALSYAHQRGIIHRDIKPGNIMIGTNGRLLLSDFGVAQLSVHMAQSSMTGAGTILGTPLYMSPEQAKGEPIDARSDIYSLGLVLYQILTGKAPFQRGDVTSMIYAQITQPPPSLRALNPQISPDLERVVLRALVKDPARRYQSIDDFVQSLRAVIRVDQVHPSPPATAAALELLPPPRSRSGVVWIGAIAGLIVVVGLILIPGLFVLGAPQGEPLFDEPKLWLIVGAALALGGAIALILIWQRRQNREVPAYSIPPPAACAADGVALEVQPFPATPASPTAPTGETLPWRSYPIGKTEILDRPETAIAFMLVLNGPQRGRQLTFKGLEASIGRDSHSNQIVIDDDSVSRQHARIRLEGNRFLIYDLGSSNGTLVNGMNVARHELRDRDEIRVGNTNLIFMQIGSGTSRDARRRLQEFDAVWDDLARVVRSE